MMLPEVTTLREKTEAIKLMNEELEGAVKRLASAETSIIVYGCTTGSFIEGLDHDVELVRRIQKIADVPAVTVSTAVVDAMKKLDFKRICVVTPYVDELNKLEKLFLEESIPGIEVVTIRGLNIVGNIPKGRLDPFSSYRIMKKLNTPGYDGVFISCTNWRTFEIIECLEKDLKKPVITSNQASLWAALREAGVREPIEGYGTLLR